MLVGVESFYLCNEHTYFLISEIEETSNAAKCRKT